MTTRTERSAPGRLSVLEQEVAVLRRRLVATERELAVADSLLDCLRRENEALRDDLYRALAEVAGISGAARCGATGGLQHVSRSEPLESGPARGQAGEPRGVRSAPAPARLGGARS